MRRRGYFVFACILALMLVGCGSKDKVKEINNNVETIEEKSDNQVNEEGEDSDSVVENTDNNETKPTTDEMTTNNTEETIQNPSAGTTTGKNESTTSTQKPATNNTNNSNNNTTTTKPSTGSTGNTDSTPKPTHPVHEHTWVEVTEEVKHYYAWRTICGKCKIDLTDLSAEDKIYHSAVVCCNGYSVQYIEVDFVTENIVKTPVVTGYKCECGAEKK